MDEQQGEIDGIHPGQDGAKQTGEAEADSKDDVARVVDVTSEAPETTHEQSSVDRLGCFAPDQRLGIVFEVMLLAIGSAEDREAHQEDERDAV